MQFAPYYGVSSTRSPSDVLRAIRPGQPLSVAQQWIEELRYMVDFACE
jgi:hypothetical protein